MGSYHAKLSPSSADRWTSCTASINAQEGIPNTNSDASRDGTCCHQILAECLENPDLDLQSYLGRVMSFWEHPESESSGEDWHDVLPVEHFDHTVETSSLTVTQEMLDAVHSALGFVRQRVAHTGGTLLVEQRVPIGHFTGEEDAGGTSDVILMYGTTIEVMDAKFGRHKVQAYEVITPAHTDIVTNEAVPEVVRGNLQMICYALGAYEANDMFYGFTDVVMTIIQPNIHHVSSYSCSVAELLKLRDFLQAKANETRDNPQYVATPDNCHFCRASGSCAAQTQAVITTTLDGFDDVDKAKPRVVRENALGSLYAVIPMVADWCKAVEARVREALLQGLPVVRNDGVAYHLVEGKMGARAWRDETEAETALKSMRLKQEQMYTRSLISPAAAEKLSQVKKVKKGETAPPPPLGATQWNRLQQHITQSKGQPAIALETDPRPAAALAAAGFDDVPDADNSDLF